jgi:hypothetical protein
LIIDISQISSLFEQEKVAMKVALTLHLIQPSLGLSSLDMSTGLILVQWKNMWNSSSRS